MTMRISPRGEVILDGIPTGYIVIQGVDGNNMTRVHKCWPGRDILMPKPYYPYLDSKFERDFRATCWKLV